MNPALEAPEGLERLSLLTEGFLRHVEDGVFPGGCFFASVVAELGARPGPVRDLALGTVAQWGALIEAALEDAKARGELEAGADTAQLAFEVHAYLLTANADFVIAQSPLPLARARRAITERVDHVRAA